MPMDDLTAEEVDILKDFAAKLKTAKDAPQLRPSEVSAVREFIAKQKQAEGPKITHESIQYFYELLDDMPKLFDNIMTLLVQMRAFDELMTEKGVLSKEEVKGKMKEIMGEYQAPLSPKAKFQLLDEVARAYR